MSTTLSQREQLLGWYRSFDSCLVAFSGGVDSAVVAKAAQVALGDTALAVTGSSASLASSELELAQQLAGSIGIRHETIHTEEFANESYTQNASDRCFHCKSQLYTQLEPLARQFNVDVIVNGANADDGRDYRPGMRAARDYEVRSPLAECGLRKADVRDLARNWELSVWDKPATPCLSSRVAYGEEVTPERLAMIDAAETYLRDQGLSTVRVRYHRGDMARLEVPLGALELVCAVPFRDHLVSRLRSLGFRFVTLDLEGFRSGSLNTLVTVDTLLPSREPSDE